MHIWLSINVAPVREPQVWTEFEMYTVTSLLSEVGGLVGLFLGASVLSLVAMAFEASGAAIQHAKKIANLF